MTTTSYTSHTIAHQSHTIYWPWKQAIQRSSALIARKWDNGKEKICYTLYPKHASIPYIWFMNSRKWKMLIPELEMLSMHLPGNSNQIEWRPCVRGSPIPFSTRSHLLNFSKYVLQFWVALRICTAFIQLQVTSIITRATSCHIKFEYYHYSWKYLNGCLGKMINDDRKRKKCRLIESKGTRAACRNRIHKKIVSS